MKFMILLDFECPEVVLFQELWAEFIVRSVSKVENVKMDVYQLD